MKTLKAAAISEDNYFNNLLGNDIVKIAKNIRDAHSKDAETGEATTPVDDIPLRSGLKLTDPDYTINENGIPCCPHDPALPMKPEGNTSHLRCGLKTFKFVCPKMSWDKCEDGKYRRICHCEKPCTHSACGRMVYLYPEKDLRLCPGVLRGTDEWESTYKIRTSVERSINHIKNSFCLGERKTQNAKTLHADLLLAGITQLITVVVADRIHKPEHFRSLKRLIA